VLTCWQVHYDIAVPLVYSKPAVYDLHKFFRGLDIPTPALPPRRAPVSAKRSVWPPAYKRPIAFGSTNFKFDCLSHSRDLYLLTPTMRQSCTDANLISGAATWTTASWSEDSFAADVVQTSRTAVVEQWHGVWLLHSVLEEAQQPLSRILPRIRSVCAGINGLDFGATIENFMSKPGTLDRPKPPCFAPLDLYRQCREFSKLLLQCPTLQAWCQHSNAGPFVLEPTVRVHTAVNKSLSFSQHLYSTSPFGPVGNRGIAGNVYVYKSLLEITSHEDEHYSLASGLGEWMGEIFLGHGDCNAFPNDGTSLKIYGATGLPTFTEDDKTTSHSAENGENDDPSIDDYVPTLEESMLGDAVDGYNEMPRLEGWDDDTTITFEKMENVPVCLGCGWEKSMGL
jgi:hypothetical protein